MYQADARRHDPAHNSARPWSGPAHTVDHRRCRCIAHPLHCPAAARVLAFTSMVKIICDGGITAQSVIHVSAIVPAIQHDRTGGRCNRQYRTGKYRCCRCSHRNTIQCRRRCAVQGLQLPGPVVPGICTEIIMATSPFHCHQSLPDKILYL